MITRRLRAIAVSATLSATLFGTLTADLGCTTGAADIGNADGKAIVRGIYFGDGPVADKLPEVWNDQLAEVVARVLPPAAGPNARSAILDVVNHRWSPEWVTARTPDFHRRRSARRSRGSSTTGGSVNTSCRSCIAWTAAGRKT